MFTICRYSDDVPVQTPADAENHIDKTKFTTPFVCGARDLGEALRRISEGAAMIRTKGEAGTGELWCFGWPPAQIIVKSLRHCLTSFLVSLITTNACSSGNVAEAVRHARSIRRAIAIAKAMDETELYSYAKQLQVPVDLLKETAKLGRLPVVSFAAGGLGTRYFLLIWNKLKLFYERWHVKWGRVCVCVCSTTNVLYTNVWLCM